jgi:hypothetical protein
LRSFALRPALPTILCLLFPAALIIPAMDVAIPVRVDVVVATAASTRLALGSGTGLVARLALGSRTGLVSCLALGIRTGLIARLALGGGAGLITIAVVHVLPIGVALSSSVPRAIS